MLISAHFRFLRVNLSLPLFSSSSLKSKVAKSTLSAGTRGQVFLGKWKVKLLKRDQLFATPWTVAYQATPSMGFSRQEYWSGLLFPSPGDLPDPRIGPGSPAL